MRESWTIFATNTTLHGLRYVFTTSGLRRVFWIMILSGATGLYLWLLRASIMDYMSLPINTQFSFEYPERGLTFPELTICNLNAVMKTKVNMAYDNPHFKRFDLDLRVCDHIRNISGNLTCGQALVCLYEKMAPYIITGCSKAIQDDLRRAVNTSQRMFNPEEFLRYYGHGFEKMLVDYCMLGENPCEVDDFFPTISQKELCYTFNVSRFTARVGEKQSRIHFAGEQFGFGIMLDAQSSESMFGDWSIGFRIIIDEEGVGIHRSGGFNVNPGSHVLVSLTPTKVYRLPPPYKSNCSQRSLPGYAVYSKEACFKQCLSNKTISDCGCRPMGEPGFPDVPVCSIVDEECAKKALDSLLFMTCECRPPCAKTYFLRSTSFSKFPNRMGQQLLRQGYKRQISQDYINENVVFLQVGFAVTYYGVTEQSSAYGSSSLLGDIGGNMGLLVGCSLLTVIEFIDFAIVFLISKLQSKSKTTDIEDIKDINNVGVAWGTTST